MWNSGKNYEREIKFTEREKEIMTAPKEMSTGSIAKKLGISIASVEIYIERIRKKILGI